MSAWNEKIKDICGMLQLELHPQAVKMLTDEDEIPASAIKAGEKYGHLAYCQAQALVHVLMNDDDFKLFGQRERDLACDKILEDVNALADKTAEYSNIKMYSEGMMCDYGSDSLYIIGTDADGAPISAEIASFGYFSCWIDMPEIKDFIKANIYKFH